MSGQTFRYRPSAIARICVPEIIASAAPLIPVVIMFPAVQYGANRDLRTLILFVEVLSPWVLAAIFVYCLWRAYTLHSTHIEFDGSELVWFNRQGRHGLLSSEVASSLSTPRVLHITSGRPEYNITIHSELDGFGDLSHQLNDWFPPSMSRLPARPTQIFKPLLRNAALYLPIILAAPPLGKFVGVFLRGISPGNMFYFDMAFPLVLACIMALYLRRTIAKISTVSASQEPPAPYIVQ